MIIVLVNEMVFLPTPKSISYLWRVGIMLGLVLLVQIVSGLLLSFQYSARTFTTFQRIGVIERMSNSGFLLRSAHIELASFFFIFIYLHLFRGLYNKSRLKADAWNVGVTMLIFLMARAFLGYVLVFGQIRYWGVRVILNFFGVFRATLVKWLWGNFIVSTYTLSFFFTLHFLLPQLLVVLALVHLLSLHFRGSRAPVVVAHLTWKKSFNTFFLMKDMLNVLVLVFMLLMSIPLIYEEAENNVIANTLSSPIHIKPEWYFLFLYTILRSIPTKLTGILVLALALVILYFIRLFVESKKYKIKRILVVVSFAVVTMFLSGVSGNPIRSTIILIGLVMTMLYFLHLALLAW